MKKRNTLILSIAAVTIFQMNLVAHPGHDHRPSAQPTNQQDHGHSHSPAQAHDHPHPHSHGDGQHHVHGHAQPNIPENLKELWGQINLRTEQLKTALENGDHVKLHEIDEFLSALLRALPERSPDLTANDRRRVQGQVNNLIRILGRIHHQADANNAKAAQRQWQVLSRILPLLARHYPEEIASYKAEETPRAQHRHGHSHEPGQSHRHATDPAHGDGPPHSHE